MKMKFNYIGLLLMVVIAASCKKDNFEAPSLTLSGKINYQGEAIQVEYDRVPFELYQYGFGKTGAIRSSFTQEGTYSSVLFSGQYKLIIPNGQGPFKWNENVAGTRDSVVIDLSSDKTLDLEVTPYYMIRTPQINAASGAVTATFKAEKIIADASAKDIEEVALYINKTQFVSGANNNAQVTMAGSAITNPDNISLNVTIPAMVPAQNYVFARIGLKIAGVEDRIFSPVQKITF
jgi:hypothetical protein